MCLLVSTMAVTSEKCDIEGLGVQTFLNPKNIFSKWERYRCVAKTQGSPLVLLDHRGTEFGGSYGSASVDMFSNFHKMPKSDHFQGDIRS